MMRYEEGGGRGHPGMGAAKFNGFLMSPTPLSPPPKAPEAPRTRQSRCPRRQADGGSPVPRMDLAAPVLSKFHRAPKGPAKSSTQTHPARTRVRVYAVHLYH